VTRLRRRKDTKAILADDKQLVIMDPTVYKGKWRDYFGNDNPIYVELGMGKGKFISELSANNPAINYIGIDMYDELIRKATEKARELHADVHGGEPTNLALVLFNIGNIENMFDTDELSRVYLNHSDPWPKARHANRRLTHPNFLNKYIDSLKPDGEIHFKTDSRSLFEFSLESFSELGLRIQNLSLDVHAEGTPEGHVFTEYESKFVGLGQPIYFVEVHLKYRG
jgi:tRNA (guanine-N7-)-methyltransferase